MCTPWTMTRFIRWRMKDWVSCFLPCIFPIDDNPDRFCSSSSQLPVKNMVLEMKDDVKRGNRGKKKLSRVNRCSRNEKRVNHGDELTTRDKNNSSSVENIRNDVSSWPSFQDEDYIVFCFKEDGAFEVVKDGKLEALDCYDSGNRSPRSVNRKLNYGEVAEIARQCSYGKRSNAHGTDNCLRVGERINHVEEGEEEQNSYVDIEPPSIASFRSYQSGKQENHGSLSVESGDSNQSDSSTGSFSFPILHWEVMGSPTQMPKSEALYIRKHKVSCASLQCIRF